MAHYKLDIRQPYEIQHIDGDYSFHTREDSVVFEANNDEDAQKNKVPEILKKRPKVELAEGELVAKPVLLTRVVKQW